jgi:hypothetical protein
MFLSTTQPALVRMHPKPAQTKGVCNLYALRGISARRKARGMSSGSATS